MLYFIFPSLVFGRCDQLWLLVQSMFRLNRSRVDVDPWPLVAWQLFEMIASVGETHSTQMS